MLGAWNQIITMDSYISNLPWFYGSQQGRRLSSTLASLCNCCLEIPRTLSSFFSDSACPYSCLGKLLPSPQHLSYNSGVADTQTAPPTDHRDALVMSIWTKSGQPKSFSEIFHTAAGRKMYLSLWNSSFKDVTPKLPVLISPNPWKSCEQRASARQKPRWETWGEDWFLWCSVTRSDWHWKQLHSYLPVIWFWESRMTISLPKFSKYGVFCHLSPKKS